MQRQTYTGRLNSTFVDCSPFEMVAHQRTLLGGTAFNAGMSVAKLGVLEPVHRYVSKPTKKPRNSNAGVN